MATDDAGRILVVRVGRQWGLPGGVVDVPRLRGLVTPWMLDRVLDAVEFPGRAVVRTQHTGSPARYASPRSAT